MKILAIASERAEHIVVVHGKPNKSISVPDTVGPIIPPKLKELLIKAAVKPYVLVLPCE